MNWKSSANRIACALALITLAACSGSNEDGSSDEDRDGGPIFDAAGDAFGGDALVEDAGNDAGVDVAADTSLPDVSDVGADVPDVAPSDEEGFAYLDGTRSLAALGQTGEFSVSAPFSDDDSAIEWEWDVSGGTIVSGQGSATVEISFDSVGRTIVTTSGIGDDGTEYFAGGGAFVFSPDEVHVVGDLDGDDDVDADDLEVLDGFLERSEYPGVSQRIGADIDLDGRISDADRVLLLSAVNAENPAPIHLNTRELTAGTRINLIHPALLDPSAEISFELSGLATWRPMRGAPGYATTLVPVDPLMELDSARESVLLLRLDGAEVARWDVRVSPVGEYDEVPGSLVRDAYSSTAAAYSTLRAATAAYYEGTSADADSVAALVAVMEAAEAELAERQAALFTAMEAAPADYLATWDRLLAANGVPELIASADALSAQIEDALARKSDSTQAVIDVICSIQDLMDIADQVASITDDISDALGHAEFLQYVPGLNIIYGAASKLVDGLNLVSSFIASLQSYVPGISSQLRLVAESPLACGESTAIAVFVEVDLASICGARGAELGEHIENTLTSALTRFLLKDVPYFNGWYDHWNWEREEMWGVAATIYDGAAGIIGGAIDSLGIQEALGGLVEDLCNWLAGGDVNPDLAYDPAMAGVDPSSLICTPENHGRTVVSGSVPTCGGLQATGALALDCDCPCEDECSGPGEGFCSDDGGVCCQLGVDGCFEFRPTTCPDDSVCEDGCDCVCENTCDPGDTYPRCVEGAVAACTGTGEPGACFEETYSFCPEGEVCLDGACVGECFPACDPATYTPTCGPDGSVTTCVPDASDCPRLVRTPCAGTEVCVEGSCEPACSDECDPASYPACGISGPETCERAADGCFDLFTRLCPDGTACEGGTCIGVCSDECALGEASCTEDGAPASCEVGPEGCTTLVTGACTTGTVCEDGSCVPTCTDECTPGVNECTPEGEVATCEIGPEGCALLTTLTCPRGTICDDGSCVTPCTNECVLGDLTCFGRDAGSCEVGPDGCTDVVVTPCDAGFVCDAGACVPECRDECVMGEATCSGVDLASCAMGADGCTDTVVTPCDDGLTCEAGACVAVCTDECTLGDADFCVDGAVATCVTGADGCGDISIRPCRSGTVCEAGTCVDTCVDECTVGAPDTCSDGSVLTCGFGPDGCAILVATACDSGLVCVDGACLPACTDECVIGEEPTCTRTGQVQSCVSGAFGCGEFSLSDCADGTVCEAGACVPACADECLIGLEPRCDRDGNVSSCVVGPEGCGVLSVTPCEDGTTCEGGVCTCADECSIGLEPTCDADGNVLSCAVGPGGCGMISVRPCPADQTCSDGECVTTCVPECAVVGEITCSTPFTQQTCVPDLAGCPILEETRCASGVCEAGVGCVSSCEDECSLTAPPFCLDGETVGGCEVGPEGCAVFTTTTCAEGGFCEEGACISTCEPECEPGSPPFCIDARTEQSCEVDALDCPRLVTTRCPTGACEDGFGCEPVVCEPECFPGETPNLCEAEDGPFVSCQLVDECPRLVTETCRDASPICDTINGCVPLCRLGDECDPRDEPFMCRSASGGEGCIRSSATGCAQYTTLTCERDQVCADMVGCVDMPVAVE